MAGAPGGSVGRGLVSASQSLMSCSINPLQTWNQTHVGPHAAEASATAPLRLNLLQVTLTQYRRALRRGPRLQEEPVEPFQSENQRRATG